MNKQIKTLHNHFKNTPKKLKIVCDWDEVIQAHEPYALYSALKQNRKLKDRFNFTFEEFFKEFWQKDYTSPIDYSPYGSSLNTPRSHKLWDDNLDEVTNKQNQIKNSPNFYQSAPFLTIAEDLLKLIKEGKIERLIFLTAYDKRKFPNGDGRKEKIFKETFDGVGYYRTELDKEKDKLTLPCYLELIPFDSEEKGQTKADWIKRNASGFDLVIDDNPNICKSLVCSDCIQLEPREDGLKFAPVECGKCSNRIVIAPYYPAIENQHSKEVLLVKNDFSWRSRDLMKDFEWITVKNPELLNNKKE